MDMTIPEEKLAFWYWVLNVDCLYAIEGNFLWIQVDWFSNSSASCVKSNSFLVKVKKLAKMALN